MNKFSLFFGKNHTFTIIRRAILIFIDAFFIIISFFIASKLIDNNLIVFFINHKFFIFFSLLIGISIYIITGQYKAITRYQPKSFLYSIILRNIIFTTTLLWLSKYLNQLKLDISFFCLYFVLLTNLIYIFRLLIRDLLIKLNPYKKTKSLKKNVVIFGAGEGGAQLATALKISNKHIIKFFVDDNPILHNRYINGIPIRSRRYLEKQINFIDQLLIAIPSLEKERQKNLINYALTLKIPVLKVPPLSDLYLDTFKIDKLRPIEIEDLLEREPVKNQTEFLKKEFYGSTVCITGAGGSIGSELCIQLLQNNPKKLILIEQNEHNLYKIQSQLLSLKNKNTKIHGILGDCTEITFLEKIFTKHNIDYVLHSAAYKHVPIVEENPISGLFNNILSTKYICLVSRKFNVKNFMLISTDKAVRPTNIMGASKRISELIVKYFNQYDQNQKKLGLKDNITLFSMVRFGNVLGSSGSVLPLFSDQISNGGPITITHPEVIRYFMTISEAAQLVLQSATLTNGGEVFLLDMGSPVKIKTLAEKLIQLRGLSIKNEKNQKGDIEIKIVGLRPGEKLFEELLIDGSSIPTSHPYIYKANEKEKNLEDFWIKLKDLEKSIENHDSISSLKILKKLVPEWKRGRIGNV